MTATETRTWEIVIGLEVHCELSTASKLFCGCPNEFGDEPNTNICPVCLGLPGSLPVLNERAVEYALRVAEALHLRVPEQSIFSRKNYFYPDMPKNYQTSQYDEPITIDGWLEVDGVRLGITRAHLEEDTGKSLHVGGEGRIHNADHSLVDYNRAGVPLLEIVSEPDIRSAEQAKRYVEELRATLLAVGVSDVKMEEGSLRIDANVSIRPLGDTEFGTRAEIKNLNSLRSLVRAVEYETRRQSELIESGERVVQETRHWDEDGGRTISGRSKEEAHDYRYFPEPDLVPVAPTDEMRERVRTSMPELPAARRTRLMDAWDIKDEDARILVGVPGLADLAENAVPALQHGVPRDLVNWLRQDVLALLNQGEVAPTQLLPEQLAELVDLVSSKEISRSQGQAVLAKWLSSVAETAAEIALTVGHRERPNEVIAHAGVARGAGKALPASAQTIAPTGVAVGVGQALSPRVIVKELGLGQVSDVDALTSVVDGVLAAEAATVEQYHASTDDKDRQKKRGFLMGQLMRELKGKGNPQVVGDLLDARLS